MNQFFLIIVDSFIFADFHDKVWYRTKAKESQQDKKNYLVYKVLTMFYLIRSSLYDPDMPYKKNLFEKNEKIKKNI